MAIYTITKSDQSDLDTPVFDIGDKREEAVAIFTTGAENSVAHRTGGLAGNRCPRGTSARPVSELVDQSSPEWYRISGR